MSTSRHPIALRLERRVGGDARLLATVMALPLVDGIFPALVLAGLLGTAGGILQVGLLVFAGSATFAVIVADLDGGPGRRVRTVLPVGVGLIVLAGVEAAVAPMFASLLDLATFERFTALVILAVAAATASARVGEYLPRPAVIVGLGLIASVRPAGVTVAVTLDPELILRAAAAAGVAVVFATVVAALAPTLHRIVDLDRFRFGSAVALGTLPLGFLGIIPGDAPLAVLVVTGLLAFDPARASGRSAGEAAAGGGRDGTEQAGTSAAGDDADRAPWL